jgi:hypothetical protein
MARYHGKTGKVSMGTPAVPVLSLNKWTLNAATDKADVTAFGDVNKVYVQGLPDLKGQVAGWFDDQESALFDAADATAPVDLELMPVAGVATIKWAGPAWLDASIDVPANGPISVSGDFVAAGAWTRTFTPPVLDGLSARGGKRDDGTAAETPAAT